MDTAPQQQGFAHIAFTVTDLQRSAEFYRRLFDARSLISGRDDISEIEVMQAGQLMIAIRRHPKTDSEDQFAFERVGLDHIGIAVANEGELEKWRARLDELGIEHSGIVKDDIGLHLNTRDPDDIPLEFFALPTKP